MSQRGALILFIFVLIVGALIGGWFYVSKFKNETTAPLTGAVPVNSTRDQKLYRNETHKFEFRYPPYWFVEEGEATENGKILSLRTMKYKEIKLSECCPFAIQSPGDQDKVVKVHDGEITVSVSQNAPTYFDQTCPRAATLPPEIETITIGSLQWHGCLTKREGFSVPQLYVESATPGRYLVVSGGLESEKGYVDVNRISSHDFIVLDILRTFVKQESPTRRQSDPALYRNEEYGFSLLHPKPLFIIEGSGPTSQTDLLLYICENSTCGPDDPLVLIMTDRDLFSRLSQEQIIKSLHSRDEYVSRVRRIGPVEITQVTFGSQFHWFIVSQGQKKIIVQANAERSIDLAWEISNTVSFRH